MSLPGSAMTLELPPRLAVNWLTWVLVLAGGLVVETVAARHPALPAGMGIVTLGCLVAWHWLRTRPGRLLRRASLEDDGRWQLQFRDGRQAAARLGPGSRLLGRSVVLRWTMTRGGCAVWLTPWDLPDADLRRLAVRLRALRHADPAPQRQVPTEP